MASPTPVAKGLIRNEKPHTIESGGSSGVGRVDGIAYRAYLLTKSFNRSGVTPAKIENILEGVHRRANRGDFVLQAQKRVELCMSGLSVLVDLVAEEIAVGLHSVQGGLDVLLTRVAFGAGVDVETVKVLHVIFGDERLQVLDVEYSRKVCGKQLVKGGFPS